MIKVRIIGGLLLCVLFGAGIYRTWGQRRSPMLEYRSAVWRATADLRKGHQIRPGDLKLPSPFVEMAGPAVQQYQAGRYLLSAKRRGDLVSGEDLVEAPPLADNSGLPIVMYANTDQDSFIAALEPGMFLKFCSVAEGNSKSKVKLLCTCAVKAVAVHRSTSASDKPWVAMQVPRQRLRETVTILGKPARPLILNEKGHER